MSKSDFADARQKLARARKHIADTEEEIGGLSNTELYRLRCERNAEEPNIRIVLDSLHEIDKSINAIVGDAVANLRSALDYIVVAIIAPISGSPKDIGFPFADNVTGFAGEVSKASLSVWPQTIRDHFINEVQAYKGGKGHSFWALNKLRNIDKHRFLVTTVSVAGVRASFRVGGASFKDASFGVTPGQSGTFIDCPPDIEFTDKLRPTFDVRINEFPDVPETPAAAFLHRVANDVEHLLDAIEVIERRPGAGK